MKKVLVALCLLGLIGCSTDKEVVEIVKGKDGSSCSVSDYVLGEEVLGARVSCTDGSTKPHLVVPYTLDANDMRFVTQPGISTADHFFQYLKDSFDILYAEGDPNGLDAPKMLSIGMHCRLLGRPGRFRALQKFLDHIQSHDNVWVCRRIDIARHWMQTFPFSG